MSKLVEVAAGVIRAADGRFLLGRRAPGSFYAGYWEFPGGKVEAGESPAAALARELREELGITVDESWPWLVREHHYEHARVRLNFFEIPRWHGEVNDHVHSELAWVSAQEAVCEPMLPANGPIFKALRLPRFIGITHACEIGIEPQLRVLEVALARGLECVQIREPQMNEAALGRFSVEVSALAREYRAIVLLNASPALAQRLGVDGVQLNGRALMQCESRPDLEWVGASCHDREQLERAARLGVDFALLGPVRETTTHAGASGIGWLRFGELASGWPMPVVALGGLGEEDWIAAREAGAHGIAAIRGAWRTLDLYPR